MANGARTKKLWRISASVSHAMLLQDNNVSDDAKLREILTRQNAMIERLEKLKAEIAKMSLTSVSADSPDCRNVTTGINKENDSFLDIVVYADPARPPWSLLVLKNMFSKHCRFLLTSHVHSSVTSEVPEPFRTPRSTTINRGAHDVSLTVIWKQVSHSPVLVVSPGSHTPIRGEANVARFMARLLKPAYDEGDLAAAVDIDTVIDQAVSLQNANSKEKAAVLKGFHSRLGKTQNLCGDDVTLADVVTYSALRTNQLLQDAPPNVKKWASVLQDQADFKF